MTSNDAIKFLAKEETYIYSFHILHNLLLPLLLLLLRRSGRRHHREKFFLFRYGEDQMMTDCLDFPRRKMDGKKNCCYYIQRGHNGQSDHKKRERVFIIVIIYIDSYLDLDNENRMETTNVVSRLIGEIHNTFSCMLRVANVSLSDVAIVFVVMCNAIA